MYSTSTQAKHWLFADEAELAKFRTEANANFIQEHRGSMTVSGLILIVLCIICIQFIMTMFIY